MNSVWSLPILNECAFTRVLHVSTATCWPSCAGGLTHNVFMLCTGASFINSELGLFQFEQLFRMVSGTKKNRAVLFFHGGVGGAASRIPLVPASEQSPCRQPGSAWPAAAGGCVSSEHLPGARLHLLKTSLSCFASKMCHSEGAGMGKARMKQN